MEDPLFNKTPFDTPVAKPSRKDNRPLSSVYSRCLLTRKIKFPISVVGKNLEETMEAHIKQTYEGRCQVEGFVKPNSIKIIRHSSGVIDRGSSVVFEVVFECDVCFPVEGMILACQVKNITKAGIRAESATEIPTPFTVFVAKDHHYNNARFNEVQNGDTIHVRVIGQRFELNDRIVGVVGELVKMREGDGNAPTKPAKTTYANRTAKIKPSG